MAFEDAPALPDFVAHTPTLHAHTPPARVPARTRHRRALRRQERLLPNAPVTRTTAGHSLQEEVPRAPASAIDDVAARARFN